MEQRMNTAEVAPEGFRAVYGLEAYARERLDNRLYELIKLRASVLNGCAFCVDMHGTDLMKAGEDVRRVLAVAAWRESQFFTDRERVALELTDAVTRIGENGVPDDVWEAAVKEFGETTVADLLVGIATINVWNRLQVATHAATPPLTTG